MASVAALQLGSIAVVIEGALSGSIAISSVLNFTGLMQAIHLPIGIVEGLVSGLVMVAAKFVDSKKLSIGFGAISLILAGIISQYASTKPDGLEWSLLNISGAVTEQTQGILYSISETVQAKTSILAEPSFGGIAGLFAVGMIMYLACIFMARQTVKADVQ